MFRDPLTPEMPARARFRPAVEALEDRSMAVATTTTLAVSPGPIFAGQAILLTATVTAPSAADPGPVSFFDNGLLVGQIQNVTPNGASAAIVVTLSAGAHSLTARFDGSANGDPSTSAAVLVSTVDPATAIQNVSDRLQVSVTPVRRFLFGLLRRVQVTIRNVSGDVIQGPFFVLLPRLPRGLRLLSRLGFAVTPDFFGRRFAEVNLPQLNPGQTFSFPLVLLGSLPRGGLRPIVLAGPGEF